jgi:homoserine acetyltransferase
LKIVEVEIVYYQKEAVKSGINMAGVETYKLGDWKLQSGLEIPDAHIAYKTFGDPASPAIIYPSWFSGCKTLAVLKRCQLTYQSYCRQ